MKSKVIIYVSYILIRKYLIVMTKMLFRHNSGNVGTTTVIKPTSLFLETTFELS